jgi:hypothetical protein
MNGLGLRNTAKYFAVPRYKIGRDWQVEGNVVGSDSA